jgi:signal transduction histidine kinase/CheY-like chemotaxis protein
MDPKSILLVEDEKILLDLYYSVLTHQKLGNKYKVIKAANAKDALALAAGERFDLVLTDYHLPGEDGINLIRKIKKLSEPTRYIIISGYLSPLIIQSALEEGVYTCLKKPCSIKTILNAIENVLSVNGDEKVFRRYIEEVLQNFTRRTMFIDTEHRIMGVNTAFRDSFHAGPGNTCHEVLYNKKSACDFCKLAEIIKSRTAQTVSGNGSMRPPHNEHIEPWRDSTGRVMGFLVSLLPSGGTAPSARDKQKPVTEKLGKDFYLMAMDITGAIVFADENLCAFLEVAVTEVKRKTIYDFLHSYFIEYLKKQDIDFMEFARTNINRQVRLDFITQQGRSRHSLLCEFFQTEKAGPRQWELLMVCVNDEKINQLTKLIEFERESSKTLISGQFDMAITLDKEQRIQAINKNCLEKLHAKKSELIGRDIKELLPQEHDLVSFNRAVTQVMTLKDVYNLRLNISYNNTRISSLVNLSGIRNSFNNEIGYVLILKDIEKELRMEATLSGIERMQALGKLAAGTAHQINNYTNTIAGSTELLNLLLHENLDNNSTFLKEADDFISLIKRSLSRLTGLTHHLTGFARAQQAPVISAGDINQVIKDSLFLIQAYVNKKTITLKTWYDESLPPLYFSPLHLEQAIINIVMNAIDAVEPDKGIISIKTFREQNHACISISDNGPGIAAEIKDRIFEAFVTTKPAGVGTGLGLNVTKGIIDSLKGTIRVESLPEKGTTLILQIPILSQEEIV